MNKKYWIVTAAFTIFGAVHSSQDSTKKIFPIENSYLHKPKIQQQEQKISSPRLLNGYRIRNYNPKTISKKEEPKSKEQQDLEKFIEKVNQGVFMRIPSRFVDNYTIKNHSFEELCDGACVYVSEEGGFTEYDFEGVDTTYINIYCNGEICFFDEYVMQDIYVALDEDGFILGHGTTHNNMNDDKINDYLVTNWDKLYEIPKDEEF